MQGGFSAARPQGTENQSTKFTLPPAPADNHTTPDKVELGRQLFFDARLSGDNTRSCASCHLPDKAFTDGLARAATLTMTLVGGNVGIGTTAPTVALGVGGKQLTRNTPTLLNVGVYTSYFWDGRVASLEEQALVPIQSPDEMNQNVDELEKELNAVTGYRAQFQAVFGALATKASIAKALAAFQRSLVSRNSPFDRFLAGNGRALSEEARRGWELFKGDAGCIRCHNGQNFSDSKFYRLGIGFGDKGRSQITGQKGDLFVFRTPGLRNVARTPPYMHDGSFETLSDVVEYYYRGVPRHMPEGSRLDIEPLLGQSYSEISDIVAFLESLSGEPVRIAPPKLP